MLLDFVPPYDATVVSKLCHDKGAILMGKTNLDEFAMGCGTVDSQFGPCKNPWGFTFNDTSEDTTDDSGTNDWRISGGSSGGSAVAVATGTCFAALASDTGGSTRNPASHVGIVGFKPSYGLISRHGLIPLTHSMDTPSIMAQFVDNVDIVFKSVRGKDHLDPTTIDFLVKELVGEAVRLDNVTIGIPQEYDCDHMSEEVRKVWYETADLVAKYGAKVISVSLPHTAYSLSCYSVINCCEVASNFACYDGIEYGYRSKAKDCETFEDLVCNTRNEAFGNTVKARIIAGNYFLLKENYDKFFVRAMKVRRLICQDFDKIFAENSNQVDFLLTPVTLTPAYPISEWNKRGVTDKSHGEDYFTQPVNLAGLPALSLPCKLSSINLPIGLQIIGPKYSDCRLLALAKLVENLVNFPTLNLFNEKKSK